MRKLVIALSLFVIVLSSMVSAGAVFGMTRWMPEFFPATNVPGFMVGPGFGLKYAPTPGEIASSCIEAGLLPVDVNVGPRTSTTWKNVIRCYEGFPSRITSPNKYEGHPSVATVDWSPYSNHLAAGKLQTVYAYPYLKEFPPIINTLD